MPPIRNRSGEYARRKTKCLQFNLCLNCQQSKGTNKWKCDACLAKRSVTSKKRRQIRATQNQCECGHPSALNSRLCEKCQARGRLGQEKRRQQHREESTCLTCGNPPVPEQATCADCQRRATISTMARYHNNIESAICAFCGGELNKSDFRCNICHEQHILRGRIYWSQKRLAVFNHYGDSCQCCNNTIFEFLEIDHINGGGSKHLSQVGRHFYEWIIKNNFPSDLQTLCSNCNCGKGKFGVCPHLRAPNEPNSRHAKNTRKRRLRAIEKYGGICHCCGEANWTFLEFDHVNNDGGEHRKIIGGKIVKWIIDNNYPDSIQLACSNCNKARGLYGVCPHQLILPEALESSSSYK